MPPHTFGMSLMHLLSHACGLQYLFIFPYFYYSRNEDHNKSLTKKTYYTGLMFSYKYGKTHPKVGHYLAAMGNTAGLSKCDA